MKPISRRFIIGAAVVLLAGIGLTLFFSRDNEPGALSEKEIAAQYAEVATRLGEPNMQTQAVLTPIDLSRPIHLAVGGLGLADNEQNRQLGDLATVKLTGAPGFELVERQSLTKILKELNLNWSGFVRAKDVVRAGKLLKADWFLVGTQAKIDETNSVVVRVVDARTGVMRDAGVFPADQPLTQLAENLAGFLRQSRQDAATAKMRVYLAVGAFDDVSVNNRQADFPAQIRGYLTAAYRGSRVTLLEREHVETLLQEVHLDMAGLTEEGGQNPPPPMQSAFWLVNGEYQSYETTNFQVEVKLDVNRIFGKSWHQTLRGLPGESIGGQVKAAIDQTMIHNSDVLTPTRASEARLQFSIGKEMSGLDPLAGTGMQHDMNLVWIIQSWNIDPTQAAQQKRNIQEAVRAFETVLLLEPTNRVAKMYLAGCLRNSVVSGVEEARNYYREIIDDLVQDKWTELAKQALNVSFLNSRLEDENPGATIRWYELAGAQTTNPAAADYFRHQAETTQANHEPTTDQSRARKQAEDHILATITNTWLTYNVGMETSGLDDFLRTFGTNQAAAAQRLGELYPQLSARAPELAPYLLAQFAVVQVDTNAPLVAEFQRTVGELAPHPEQVFQPDKFWWHIWPAYKWSYSHQLYGTAAGLLEGKLRAAALYPKHVWGIGNADQLGLGFAYLGGQEWEKALKVFETFSNQTVQADNDGPWGNMFTMIFPAKQADYCREKLHLRAGSNPLEFNMGKPLLCGLSTFMADDNGLWVGIGNQLLHLDFELNTNLAVNLPVEPDTLITALCLTSSNLWIATRGDGLVGFDKASRKCRCYTEKDGLMMNYIASLCLADKLLWIGYGQKTSFIDGSLPPEPGGLGNLDLTTGQFVSFTPSLRGAQKNDSEPPPRQSVFQMTVNAAGDVWLLTDETDPAPHLRRYQPGHDSWKSLRGNCIAVAGDTEQLALGEFAAPTLSLFNCRGDRWRNLNAASQLPAVPVSTLTLEGNRLWAGGRGYIALVDPIQDEVLHFAYVDARFVDRIQTGGGYVWAQFNWRLYRAALSTLQ